MSAIMAPMVVSVHSVVGLDFAGGLTPGWHSTQFPPYFFFGAVISGIALVIMLTIVVRRGYGLQDVHHRVSPQRAGQGHARRQPDAQLTPMSGRRSGRSTAATSPSKPNVLDRVFGFYAPALLGERSR